LVGELSDNAVKYRTQTSCLMPLANAQGKHIVTIEGINRPGGELTEVQKALVDESGTQCGFCTVGFIMSLTGFCIDETEKSSQSAISSIDGNICRCTGYKSIERAALRLCDAETRRRGDAENLNAAIEKGIVPEYFSGIKARIENLKSEISNPKSKIQNPKSFVGGGTDLYVQKPEEMVYTEAENLFDNADLRKIEEKGEFIEVGASATVTDLLVSPVMQNLFPNLYKHLKLVSSTPIRNMATLAGNFVNASPIGDMTIWFLALDAEIELSEPPASAGGSNASTRAISLKDFYLGYKNLAKSEEEFITKIRFHKKFSHFNFEKVCKRTYLDIASVNTAISIKSEPPASAGGLHVITEAHVSAGGIAPIPLYLTKTSEFLRGKEINEAIITEANEILQTEISPISDVRGSVEYKRLLLRQLFTAHFIELFDLK
jgi:xanthine dehydrogenase small subunit